jgi:hypothetical protein
MKLYTYYPEFDENDCLLWHVHENATNRIIDSFIFEEDAEEFAYKLENGYGFNGFTPAFMLVRTPKTDINEAFIAEFA